MELDYWLGGWIRDRHGSPEAPLFVMWASPWQLVFAYGWASKEDADRVLVSTLCEAVEVRHGSGGSLPLELRVQSLRQQRIISAMPEGPRVLKAPENDVFRLMAEDTISAHGFRQSVEAQSTKPSRLRLVKETLN